MDESEDTTTSVMSTGGNRALSTECPVRAKGIITGIWNFLVEER